MNAPDRVARAASAKVWLASLALPAATRVPVRALRRRHGQHAAAGGAVPCVA